LFRFHFPPCARSIFALSNAIEEILRPGRGYLLWDYQFIRLIGLWVLNPEDKHQTRKNLNKKLVDTMARLDEIEVEPGYSLLQLLQDRMPMGFVIAPNVRGAAVLYEALPDAPNEMPAG